MTTTNSSQPVRTVQPSNFNTREYAVQQDASDPLSKFKTEFLIPTKSQLRSKTLPRIIQGAGTSDEKAGKNDDEDPCIYLCGNSLGLQPRRTATRIQQYLDTWATQGVFGHFKPLEDSPLPTWLDADDEAARGIAPIVGADVSEVAVMQTLTANLHFLMAKFYRPSKEGAHKIILESKAFPSDHFVVESQITYHGLDPQTSMVTIEPPSSESPLLTTDHIINIIDSHAIDTALILLPGIQFYTGQLLDIKTITAHAHKHKIPIIWDLAHAVGNVPLELHNWEVDAAAWCSYKYLNAGPGSIGGLFVHSHNTNSSPSSTTPSKPPQSSNGHQGRLSGWWGSSKPSRFAMTNSFEASPGAAAFQLSNPSIFDITSLSSSLSVFASAGGMSALRQKSLLLTSYLETLLLELKTSLPYFTIITSSNPEERGAQLSVRLNEGLLGIVMKGLEERGVVVDERKPDVIRVAPAPLYNSWADVWEFVTAFRDVLESVQNKDDAVCEEDGEDHLLLTS